MGFECVAKRDVKNFYIVQFSAGCFRIAFFTGDFDRGSRIRQRLGADISCGSLDRVRGFGRLTERIFGEIGFDGFQEIGCGALKRLENRQRAIRARGGDKPVHLFKLQMDR